MGLNDSKDNHFNFVINSPTGGEQIPIQENISVIKGHNKGYDFGAYKQSLESVDLRKFDRFIFINDTARGPFIPNYVPTSLSWVDMFLKDIDEKVKLVGPTYFNQNYHRFLQVRLGLPEGRNKHIQAWCFGIDKTALDILLAHKKFDSVGKGKCNIIKEHEIGISQRILDHHFDIKPFLLSRCSGEEHGDVNHDGGYFETTLNPLEVMFFKTVGSGTGRRTNRKILNNYTRWKIQEKEKQ